MLYGHEWGFIIRNLILKNQKNWQIFFGPWKQIKCFQCLTQHTWDVIVDLSNEIVRWVTEHSFAHVALFVFNLPNKIVEKFRATAI